MGNQSRTNPGGPAIGLCWWAVLLLFVAVAGAPAQSATPLLLPSGLAYDAQGDLYFADASQHVIRELTAAGVLAVVAGTGTQGFSGDGGPANAARLDTPGAVVVDGSGNLVFCDTHNHRIRRMDALTGLITTVAGTGVAGLSADGLPATATNLDLGSALAMDGLGNLFFADGRRDVVRRIDHATGLVTTVAGNAVQGSQGDGGPARAASLDGPAGLALDTAGNLYISDAHNERVRRVDAGTGIITTVAGTGLAGYSSGLATAAALRLPRGLAIDAAGGLYIVDAGNNRLRRVDPTTGQIVAIAGGAVEGFGGDGGPAVLAQMDSPRAVALSPAGLATLTDANNARVRQLDAGGVITTIAGAGSVAPGGLSLTGPASVSYGSGSLTASLGGGTRSGSVILSEGSTIVGTAPLAGNTATFSTGALGAGAHLLVASLAADATVRSAAFPLQVVQASLLATPVGISQTYGLAVPLLSGGVRGVLAQDAGLVQVGFSSAATALSGVGSYPITAVATGSAAANYVLTTVPAAVTITKAPSTLSLTTSLVAHLGSGTTGQPGGSVTLLDGGALYATSAATTAGDVQFSAAALSNGSHTLSAVYAGDSNFLTTASAPISVTISPAAAGDFSFAPSGPAAVSVAAGTDALFAFTAAPVTGALSSPVVFGVSGLPSGATASFSPGYLPPGALPATVTLTVHTLKTAGLVWPGRLVVAMLFGTLLWRRRRVGWMIACLLLAGVAGCGDRVNSGAATSTQSRTYNLTVTATATSNNGATLVHSVPVTLTLQ